MKLLRKNMKMILKGAERESVCVEAGGSGMSTPGQSKTSRLSRQVHDFES